MLKKVLPILILIYSCGSTRKTSDLVFDQKFKACTDEKYDLLANQSLPTDTLLFQKEHIHQLLENKLLQDGYLKEISKTGYLELFEKDIKPDFFEDFKEAIGFDPELLFPRNSFISCYGLLYHRLHLFNDKSWQYKFGYAYNQYEKYGKGFIKSPYIKAALKEIPENKFQNIIYRKVFLDLLYRYYNK